MKTLHLFIGAVLLICNLISVVIADDFGQLPIHTQASMPVWLLELGAKLQLDRGDKQGIQISKGQLSTHTGATEVKTEAEAVTVLHPGFGNWNVNFRFKIQTIQATTQLIFWARWRQGGDPNVCKQTFEIWAGPNTAKLELRATHVMQPKGWDYAWIAADVPFSLKRGDAIIEIRDSGAGHDAKVFDAFLLAPPLSTLPVVGSIAKPVVLLELGKAPLLATMKNASNVQMMNGTVSAGIGAESVSTEKDEVQVLHQGFGRWNANFRFKLIPSLAPGKYRFFARYKSGGEVSQVSQTFQLKAGDKPEKLALRGNFKLINPTPWEYQWLTAEETVTLLPGDRWLEINNEGKADGAKVFDAFLLQLATPMAAWMDGTQAKLRNHFMALTKMQPDAKRRLYVLDGKGEHAATLFRGLALDAAKIHYDHLSVAYMIGTESEDFARRLNISALPAAVITDDHYGVLGILSKPRTEQEVMKFLVDPVANGTMPTPVADKAEIPKTLQRGFPTAWLVGGLQDGLAGMSVFGLDNEAILRPNPGQPYLSLRMMGGEMRHWSIARTQNDGSVDIEPNTSHSYGWSRGAGYAQLYLHVEHPTQAKLHLEQPGIRTAAWLDGQALKLENERSIFPVLKSVGKLLKGVTTEGLLATAVSEQAQSPQVGILNLTPGWHSVLLKLVMQHEQNQRFYFIGKFTDLYDHPLNAIKTQLSDPGVEMALSKIATQFRPQFFVDAAANLPHPGEPLKLRIDMRWHPILEEASLPVPLLRFQAKMRLRLVDYWGKEIATREIADLFPGEYTVDFGKTSESGYYAVYASLLTLDGKSIFNYPADGFTVVRGFTAQKQRMAQKKLWNNDYYALAEGDKSFLKPGDYFNWLERMGIGKSYGSYPGFDAKLQATWEQAKKRGLILFADSSGDSHWLNNKPEDAQAFFKSVATFTQFFKATNEIDIRTESEWQNLREPKHWVARAKREYELAHQLRKDAHYVGGSLVRPGEQEWFKQVVQLGLDQYQDAWDVHAYPQLPPRLAGSIGNSAHEDDRGVLSTFADLGKKNHLPFWLGETGAKALHGATGRRWQAEQTAKMIAWANSRSDYLGLAFCIAHEYDLAYGRLWDYSMGHKPGEAAMYTASALIDGLTYRAYSSDDEHIQAGYFGNTLMLWRTDEINSLWPLKLDPNKAWVLVDVVGHMQELSLDTAGNTKLSISTSPIYVLPRSEYEMLTRF